MADTSVKEPEETMTSAAGSRGYGRFLRWGLLLTAVLLTLLALFPALRANAANFRLQTFATIFLGIFIEAVPFLLAGSLVSGFIELFVNQATLTKLIPKRPIPGALVGSLLGFVFPVCECGVVPVTRRLYQKGLPLPIGIAFLLSAPVINPIVLASTYVAFGWGPVLIGRFAFSLLIAFVTGLLFSFARPQEILRPATAQPLTLTVQPTAVPLQLSTPDTNLPAPTRRVWQALVVATDDFVDMARYLIIGSLLAAAMQTFVPQPTLLALGGNPVSSVLVMMALAFILSICSTVDAFLALSFVNTFSTGSLLSFLVFGPMVDIKSALMFIGVFRRRTVLYLILIPFALTLLITVFINLNFGW